MINLIPNNPHESGMFIKLNKQFPNILCAEGEEAVSYGGIISYLELNEINQDILQVVPKKYQSSFSLSLMKISGEVPPHTDSNVKAVINFYIKPGNYRTVFFDGVSPSYQIENQTNGRLFERDQLFESDYFIAKDSEAFCLNVERIHAVDSLDDNPTERVAVCLSTCDYDFKQVCSMLNDTKYVN